MNRWDRAFWLFFVLLEAAIIIGNLFFYSLIGVIMGFIVIVAGFAKVGDHVFHKSVRSELLENKETMKKMANWLNRQYELTQGLKNIHDSRIHKLDGKRTDLEEQVERKYRELAGKIIDLENRLSLVSRALLSQSKKTVQAAVHKSSEAVWEDITQLANTSKSVSTLSRGVKNKVLSVHPDRIILRSELTKSERTLLKEEFSHFWGILRAKKKLHFPKDIQDPKLVRAGSIIISFLARLPYIEHSVKPRMLHLMDKDTHDMGTLKAYGGS
ncbi:MAG: hypothetical protein JXC85_03495 [Candidatus Aenigmarchaeota archaeon]|nr:hypothetical protein [Candidatus Aenigmarchaeota archaeon]